MNSSPPLDAVYQAVFTLYHNPDPTEKEKASLWLGELQRSVYSWKVADEMLHQKRDLESCYFAAQTMRTKIQLSFHELPTEAHNSLRDSLLEHIGQVNDATNTVIVTQLCLALADLALQMSTWQKPVVDLIGKFGQTNVWPLLEILTVLPEEVNSRLLRLGANRRQEIMQELSSTAPTITEFLKLCLSNGGENPHIHIRILRCFTSWVSIQAITLPDVADNIVVAHAFHILSNQQAVPGVHEAATDCVCALLQCLEDNNNQHALELQLFSGVVSLEEGFHLSVAHEDQEKSMNYCRIFTELAETFLEKIVSEDSSNKPHFAVKILDLVLTCVGHHDYEVAEITFNLWYRLSEEVYQKNSDVLTALFKPYVERLIEALCRHCQMEPDHEGLLEDGDDFADFRMKVSELIKDVVFIVGSSNCFRQMFISLQGTGVTWDSSEAALFIMQAVAKNILPEENDVVPKVVEAILNLPENTHVAVRHTSVLLLGELCEWIERHPQSLEPVLNFLLYCLQQPHQASAAAGSLQSICSACRDHMGIHFTGLVQIIQSLDTFSISNEAAIGLLKGVSVILGQMPPDQIQRAMKEICWIQISPLCQLVENDVKTERGTKTDPALWLDRLAAVFRHTNPHVENGAVHPCQSVITEMWPILSNACTKYQADGRVMERCCRCLRFAVRCVGKQSAHLLEPLVKQIVSLYQRHQHSCFLYLGSILVDEYATEPGCVQGLLDMLQAFLIPTFIILQETNGLKNHPDTVDDLFRLCARFLQRAPVPFLQCPALHSIIQCAVLASTLDHRDANASVMKFFYDLIHCGRNNENQDDFEVRNTLVKGIVRDNGQALVNNLIHACVFCLHSYMLSDVADVIMELMLYDRAAVCQWLELAVKALPTQNSGGSITATHKQLIDFHHSLTRAEGSKAVTHALRDFARLFR
ncbi:Transportin-3 [Cryptotermes secundus]|uniref:Transportin-3 n=1 Tax=Cryptotermes secundus TaxID=105785 RepID=A0A2J7RC24_9NEOP|nr:transportin-3 isoform X1 [Cryptotermes secundus]PNF38379.1 Transportin-3 [Cryptotermes secundus]